MIIVQKRSTQSYTLSFHAVMHMHTGPRLQSKAWPATACRLVSRRMNWKHDAKRHREIG